MHHIGCMAVLNLTWFRAAPLPRGEREFPDEKQIKDIRLDSGIGKEGGFFID
jgi:hypothetical protein